MINNYIDYELKNKSYSINIIKRKQNSISFGYPCTNSTYDCTPYIVHFKPATYRIELWGASGHGATNGAPGKGGYTSGEITFNESTTLYFYVGTHGYYNVIKLEGVPDLPTNYAKPGGATDVRINSTENWYDDESLISRIMVAAGGGGGEWNQSFGGNGGGLVGGESIIGRASTGTTSYEERCPGASQTSGGNCPSFYHLSPRSGFFGYGLPPDDRDNPNYTTKTDDGGWGGGGYYVGTSYSMAGAGSGGSSFISGHPGCNAVNETLPITHTNQPNHYSGYIFNNTVMINGSCEMPLPSKYSTGIYEGEGAFRIGLPWALPTINENVYIIHTLLFTVIILTTPIKKC